MTTPAVDAELMVLNRARSMCHGEQLSRRARTHPDKIAFKFQSETRTYAELDQRVNQLSHALASLGVAKGDRVATLMMNRLEVVETYMAASRMGAIAVPVNFRLRPAEIAYILGNCTAAVIVVEPDLLDEARQAIATLDQEPTVIVTGAQDATADGAAGPISYEALLARFPTDDYFADVVLDDPAFIMYTSGTTGYPKGAVLSHYNLVMNTLTSMSTMGISRDDEVWLSGLPLFHIGGLNGLQPYLLLGGTSVLLPSGQFDPQEVVDTFVRERITGCYLVPTQWQQVCEVPGIGDADLALRRISWGASIAPPSVLQLMADTFPGLPTFNAFGQTEMSSVTCVLRGEDAVRKMGSVGKPVGSVEVRIVDDNMDDVPEGEVGEIVYRAPTVMQGYWNNPEATAEAFHGGWFHSGDLVRRDEEGYIYVVDRKKDMIISGGENIYCAEVEAVIDAHPSVAEVSVIGVPHERWVETPMAIVVLKDGADPVSEDDIIEWCKERMASYKKPSQVAFVDALPRNASGKVLKTTLRADWAAENE